MIIQLKDGRGDHMIGKANENFNRVLEYLGRNPNSTIKKCAEDMGLSRPTVAKYFKIIRDAQEK